MRIKKQAAINMQLEDIAGFDGLQHSGFVISRAENWKQNCKLNCPTEAVVVESQLCLYRSYTLYIHSVPKGSVEATLWQTKLVLFFLVLL